MPPDIAHLCCANDGNDDPVDVAELSTSHFSFNVVPFVATFHVHLDKTKAPNDPSFGLLFNDDPVPKRAFVTDTAEQSAAVLLCSFAKPLATNFAEPVFSKSAMNVSSLHPMQSIALLPHRIRGWGESNSNHFGTQVKVECLRHLQRRQ